MDLASGDELRMLRARAYGPSADIADDAQAVSRLRELEESLRAGPGQAAGDSVGDGAWPPDAAAPRGQPVVEPAAVGGATAQAGASPMPGRWAVSRHVGIAWAVSVVFAASFAATATYAVTSIIPVSRQADARQIAALEPDPESQWPAELFGVASSGTTYQFHGLTVLETAPGTAFNDRDAECLVVVATADIDRDNPVINGPMYFGCREGAFPATVSFTVEETMPAELREHVPQGTALQFVLDGDRVGVFSDAD